MCSSSGAYKRSDSAISHSLSIPFKVSLDLLFTDSHFHCQGASRDLNQVLCGPEQGNIFTRVHVSEPVHPVGLRCVYMKASRKTCVFVKKTSRRARQEMLNGQQVHTSVASREGQVALTLLISRRPQVYHFILTHRPFDILYDPELVEQRSTNAYKRNLKYTA